MNITCVIIRKGVCVGGGGARGGVGKFENKTKKKKTELRILIKECLFNNHVLIVAPVTLAPASATTPSAEFL